MLPFATKTLILVAYKVLYQHNHTEHHSICIALNSNFQREYLLPQYESEISTHNIGETKLKFFESSCNIHSVILLVVVSSFSINLG